MVIIEKLIPGEVFFFSGDVLMKIHQFLDVGVQYNAIELATGWLRYIPPTSAVTPLPNAVLKVWS